MNESRRLSVLRAIVQDYVDTSEPVGSKALLERHQLGVSAATVRNDMAALEEEGLIAAPHTSAGRIPTDAGYRLFVDRLVSVKPMSPGEKRAIAQFLDGAVDLDDVVDRTVRLLSALTQQVAADLCGDVHAGVDGALLDAPARGDQHDEDPLAAQGHQLDVAHLAAREGRVLDDGDLLGQGG